METKIDEAAEPLATHCTVYPRGDIHITTKGEFIKDVFKSGKMPTGQLQVEFFPKEKMLVVRKLTTHKAPVNK